ADADAHIVYAVRTTGVYCRPSSCARLPRRENVEFFASAAAAEAAGYRPSRRTGADRTSAAAARAELDARACRLIESNTTATLDEMEAMDGISTYHLHRVFMAETGRTPKAYAAAQRANRLRQELSTPQATVTDSIYGAGFNSNSRFYETSEQGLSMQARQFS